MSLRSSSFTALLVAWALFSVACDGPRKTETDLFEEAEVHYRRGAFENALDGYQSFLKLYPESPLADVAEMRIRTIHREVSSVLGRKESPRPVYHPPRDAGELSLPESGAEADE